MFSEKRNMTELGNLISPAQNEKCGDNEYPVLSMTMHQGLVLQSDKFKKTIASKDRSEYKVVRKGQLVVSFPIDEGVLAAQRIVDAGIVSPAYNIWNIDQDVILPHFLEYALRCDRAIDYYKSRLRGSTARRRSLPKESFLQFRVPVPSISEQQHILHVLRTMEEVLSMQKQQLEALDTLIKARFVEMFGDPDIEPRYPVMPISEITEVASGGTPSRTEKDYWIDGNIRWVKTTELQNNIIEDTEEKITESGLRNSSAKVMPVGTILIAMYGQGKTRGMTGYLAKECTTNQACACLLPSEGINQKYLWQYMILSYDRLRDLAKGGNQPNLNAGLIKAFPVLVPPIEEQNAFAAFVTEVDKSKSVVQKAFDEARLLSDSLMQEYFG